MGGAAVVLPRDGDGVAVGASLEVPRQASRPEAETEEVETLAGLLLSIKEDFPKLQETINFGRCHFTVLEIDKRRILKIKVRIDPTTEGDNA